MRTFYTFFILLAVPLAVWGQTVCEDGRLKASVRADMGYWTGGNSVERVPRQMYNIANTHYVIDGQTKRRVVLRAFFPGVAHNRKQSGAYIRFRMDLSNATSIEPAKKNGDGHNYPDGWGTQKWRHSIANNPSGPDDLNAPMRPNSNNNGYVKFTRFTSKSKVYTIGAKYTELDRNQSSIDSPYMEGGGNPVGIAFEIIKDETYVKNIRIPLKQINYIQVNFLTGRACESEHDREDNHINFSIDRIRPTFENMAETTTKVDEVFELSIPAKDVDESGATIAQNFPTNVTPKGYQDMEDGVFINLISVKKIVNLAGGGVNAKRLITTTAFQKACI